MCAKCYVSMYLIKLTLNLLFLSNEVIEEQLLILILI